MSLLKSKCNASSRIACLLPHSGPSMFHTKLLLHAISVRHYVIKSAPPRRQRPWKETETAHARVANRSSPPSPHPLSPRRPVIPAPHFSGQSPPRHPTALHAALCPPAALPFTFKAEPFTACTAVSPNKRLLGALEGAGVHCRAAGLISHLDSVYGVHCAFRGSGGGCGSC